MSRHFRVARLTRKLRKAWALSRAEWLLLIRASGLLLAVELGLKLLPFKTLLALLRGSGVMKGERPVGHPVSLGRMAYLVEVASHYHVLEPTCLKKALVLYRLLRRRGMAVELVVGVTKAEGKFEAHAWLEHRGQVIGEGPAVDRYAPLRCFNGGDVLAKDIRGRRQTP